MSENISSTRCMTTRLCNIEDKLDYIIKAVCANFTHTCSWLSSDDSKVKIMCERLCKCKMEIEGKERRIKELLAELDMSLLPHEFNALKSEIMALLKE